LTPIISGGRPGSRRSSRYPGDYAWKQYVAWFAAPA
jgi:hypothetical protein